MTKGVTPDDDDDDYEGFGNYINGLRRYRGLNQIDLAVRCDRAQSWISDLELGKKRSARDLSILRILARALDVDVQDLITRDGYLRTLYE